MLIEEESSQPQNMGTATNKRKRLETHEKLQEEAHERKLLMALARQKNKKAKAQQPSSSALNRDADIATRVPTRVGGHICV